MTELLILPLPASNVAIIPCAPGTEVRLLTLNAACTGPVLGEQAFIKFSRSSAPLAVSASPPMPTSIDTIAAYIGATAQSQLLIELMNVVSGVNTFSAIPIVQELSLPDIWWPWAVTVTLSMSTVTPTAAVLLYEVRKVS